MGNMNKCSEDRSSKFWMRMIVNTCLKKDIDEELEDKLEWLSPVSCTRDQYAECRLGSKKMMEMLGITDRTLFNFWQDDQPCWDGIALSRDGKTLYIVESKAYISQLNSQCCASPKSKCKIEAVMKEVHEKYYPMNDFDVWMKEYYQLGSRMTFLKKLKELLPDANNREITDVKLLLINFVDDFIHKPEPKEVWEKYYREVFEKMTGSAETPEDVIVINYSVRCRGVE